jgi:hypothetical protein
MRVLPASPADRRPERRGPTPKRAVLTPMDLESLHAIERNLTADLGRIDKKRGLDRARVERRIAEARADTRRARRVGDETVERAERWEHRMAEAVEAAREALDALPRRSPEQDRPSDVVRRWFTTGDDERAVSELLPYGLGMPCAPRQTDRLTSQDHLDRYVFARELYERAQIDLQVAHAQTLREANRARAAYERLVAGRRERLSAIDARAREDRARVQAEADQARLEIHERSARRT